MFTKFNILILFFTIIIIPQYIHAESIFKDYKKNLEYADYLFTTEDYFRAITEYKRVLFLLPSYKEAPSIYLKIIKSYYNAGRYEEAITECDDLTIRYPKSPEATTADYYSAISEYYLRNYELAIKKIHSFIRYNKDSNLIIDAEIYKVMCLINMGYYEKALSQTENIKTKYPNIQKQHLYKYLLAKLEKIDDLPDRSPALGGICSAIFPGMGQFISTDYFAGLSSLLICGLFGSITYYTYDVQLRKDNKDDRNFTVAITSSVITAIFYSANIVGGVHSTVQYNRYHREVLIIDLEKDLVKVKLEGAIR